MKQKYKKICPQCGSKEVSHSIIGEGILQDFCKDCNFMAPTFPEMTDQEISKFREKLK